MNAFITFCRQNTRQNDEKETHLLGIKNPKNISVLEKFNLKCPKKNYYYRINNMRNKLTIKSL